MEECPICLESMDLTDVTLLPCPCDYQVCLWCLQRIRQEGNNRCPQCRRLYQEALFRKSQSPTIQSRKWTGTPNPDEDDDKHEKALDNDKTNRNDDRNKHPTICRVVNVPNNLLNAQILAQFRYFGKYGRIVALTISTTVPQLVFITFAKEDRAALTQHVRPRFEFQSVQDIAKLGARNETGMTCYLGAARFCVHAIRGVKCINDKCLFAHVGFDFSARYCWKAKRKPGYGLRPWLTDQNVKDLVYHAATESIFGRNLGDLANMGLTLPISSAAIAAELKEWTNVVTAASAAIIVTSPSPEVSPGTNEPMRCMWPRMRPTTESSNDNTAPDEVESANPTITQSIRLCTLPPPPSFLTVPPIVSPPAASELPLISTSCVADSDSGTKLTSATETTVASGIRVFPPPKNMPSGKSCTQLPLSKSSDDNDKIHKLEEKWPPDPRINRIVDQWDSRDGREGSEHERDGKFGLGAKKQPCYPRPAFDELFGRSQSCDRNFPVNHLSKPGSTLTLDLDNSPRADLSETNPKQIVVGSLNESNNTINAQNDRLLTVTNQNIMAASRRITTEFGERFMPSKAALADYTLRRINDSNAESSIINPDNIGATIMGLGDPRRRDLRPGFTNQDPTPGDPRLEDPTLGNPRLGDSRFGEARIGDARFGGARFEDARFEDAIFEDAIFGDPRMGVPRMGDPRLGDPRLEDPRFGDPRFGDPRLGDPRLGDPRLGDPRLGDPRLGDPRFGDPRFGDPRMGDPRMGDPRLEDPRLEDPRFGDPRFGDPRMGDPRMGDPILGDPRMGDPRMGDPRMGDPRMGDPRMGDPRMGDPRMGDPRMGDPRMGDPRMGDPRMGDPRMGDPRMGDPRMGDPRMGDPRMGDPRFGDHTRRDPRQFEGKPPNGRRPIGPASVKDARQRDPDPRGLNKDPRQSNREHNFVDSYETIDRRQLETNNQGEQIQILDSRRKRGQLNGPPQEQLASRYPSLIKNNLEQLRRLDQQLKAIGHPRDHAKILETAIKQMAIKNGYNQKVNPNDSQDPMDDDHFASQSQLSAHQEKILRDHNRRLKAFDCDAYSSSRQEAMNKTADMAVNMAPPGLEVRQSDYEAGSHDPGYEWTSHQDFDCFNMARVPVRYGWNCNSSDSNEVSMSLQMGNRRERTLTGLKLSKDTPNFDPEPPTRYREQADAGRHLDRSGQGLDVMVIDPDTERCSPDLQLVSEPIRQLDSMRVNNRMDSTRHFGLAQIPKTHSGIEGMRENVPTEPSRGQSGCAVVGRRGGPPSEGGQQDLGRAVNKHGFEATRNGQEAFSQGPGLDMSCGQFDATRADYSEADAVAFLRSVLPNATINLAGYNRRYAS